MESMGFQQGPEIVGFMAETFNSVFRGRIVDITGFESRSILHVCMEYLHRTRAWDNWFYNSKHNLRPLRSEHNILTDKDRAI